MRQNDDRIRQKIEAYRDDEPLIPNWFNEAWLKWTPETLDFHHTEPQKYHTVEQVSPEDLPPRVIDTFEAWQDEAEARMMHSG